MVARSFAQQSTTLLLCATGKRSLSRRLLSGNRQRTSFGGQPRLLTFSAFTDSGQIDSAAMAQAAPQDGSVPEIVHEMLSFINYAWTPFHAVEEASRRLLDKGFQHLRERDEWALQPGGRYFFTRNMSTIVAFAVGARYEAGNGVYMIGAHTDSPCLKLKPVSKRVKKGCSMVAVEPYGGGLWHTWFDRDLSVAGRVLVRENDQFRHRLVKIERPIMRIPMLAIHLNRTVNSDGFKVNAQDELVPLLTSAIKQAAEGKDKDDGKQNGADGAQKRHHAVLLEAVAKELGCGVEDIVDVELHVCDTQPGTVAGINNEFVYTGRLDNLAMSYCALKALLDTCGSADALADETGIRAVALFDHEEVGSDSAQGAGGPVMRDTITRATRGLAKHLGAQHGDVVERALQNSFLVSADMAHALHPNYASKHDPEHEPQFHKGLVIKHNVNQRYATNAVSAALFREIARAHDIPCQEFSVRSDMPCGSTIGPILASSLGCRTLDVGIPQLSMHSIREMCGTHDVLHSYNHFAAFFKDFAALDAKLDIDLAPPNIKGTIEDVPCDHVH